VRGPKRGEAVSGNAGAGAVVAAAVALLVLVTFACAHHPSGQGSASREASAASPRPDGGLPAPPPASRTGLIVPSDMGLGAGPAGPSTNSGTPPATPQPSVPNGT
jgi:hypothetical protein